MSSDDEIVQLEAQLQKVKANKARQQAKAKAEAECKAAEEQHIAEEKSAVEAEE